MQQPSIWVNLLERDGWILINMEGGKLGIIMSVTEGGQAFLRIAGYHTGESKFIGERHNVLSIKVEPIPENLHDAFLTLVRNALPAELRSLPISFL